MSGGGYKSGYQGGGHGSYSSPFNVGSHNTDPTAAISQGLAAVADVLRFGRTQSGLPHGNMGRLGANLGAITGTNVSTHWPNLSKTDMNGNPVGDYKVQNDYSGQSSVPNLSHGYGFGGGGGRGGGDGYKGGGGGGGQGQGYGPQTAGYSGNPPNYASNNGVYQGSDGYPYSGNGVDSGAPAPSTYGGSGGYAKGGLVKGYAYGGFVTPDDSDSDGSSDDGGGNSDLGGGSEIGGSDQSSGSDQVSAGDAPVTFGGDRPWYSQDNGMLPVNMAAAGGRAVQNGAEAVMDYLHGNGGWTKPQVDRALQMADSTEATLAAHDQQDQNPSEDQSEVGTPPATTGSADMEDDNDRLQKTPLGKGDTGDIGESNPDNKQNGESAATSAVRAIGNAIKTGGMGYAHGLMQGMRQLWNAHMGHSAVAAQGSPERPADAAQAADSFNKASQYLPGNDEMSAVSNDKGGLTLKVNGKTYDLPAPTVTSLFNPGTGMQFDKVLQKGPNAVIEDHQAKQDQFNNPAARMSPSMQRAGGQPQAGNDRVQFNNPAWQKAHGPGTVTIFGQNKFGHPTNGYGEVIRSNDPRSAINRDARAKQALEDTKSEAATERAKIAAGSRTDVQKAKSATSEENNKRTNEQRDTGNKRTTDAKNRYTDEFGQHNRNLEDQARANEQGRGQGRLMQADPNLAKNPDEVRKRAQQMNPSGVTNAPRAPQPGQRSAQDTAALNWAHAHPDTPQAKIILKHLGAQ